MAEEVILPKLGNTVEECIIKKWNKNVGDTIAIGDVVCEVETDKTSMDVTASVDGVLRHIIYQEDDVVAVKSAIAIVGTLDEDITELIKKYITTNEVSQSQESAQQHEKEKNQDNTKNSVVNQVEQENNLTTNATLQFSPRAKEYLSTKGLSPKQFLQHFPFVNFYTSSESLVEEKDIISFFDSIAPISPPALQALIKQNKILNIKEGSGVGSRIVEADIDALSDTLKHASTNQQTQGQIGTSSGMENVAVETNTEIKGMRKVIATRMMDSLQSTAQLTLTTQAQAKNLQELRKAFKKDNISITINDILLYLTSRVLSKNLWANSTLIDNSLVTYSNVNLGCAVQTDKGLMVPVIKQAEKKSLYDISMEIKELSSKCKEGSITPEYLQEGTFTTTNLGAFGIQSFTPILNAPQTAILGIGTIALQAVQTQETYVFEPHMYLSFTFDHRAYDGLQAAKLLQDFSTSIATIKVKNYKEFV